MKWLTHDEYVKRRNAILTKLDTGGYLDDGGKRKAAKDIDQLFSDSQDKVRDIIQANTDEWGQVDAKQIGQQVVWLFKIKEKE